MRYTAVNDLDWESADDAGVVKADIGPGVSCWRIDDGASFGEHGHEQPETFLVLSGALRFNDSRTAQAGTIIYTPPGERHAATALGETVFVVVAHTDREAT